jgi:hypothetical protein
MSSTLEERHPWVSGLTKTDAAVPKHVEEVSESATSSVLWTVQVPSGMDVSSLQSSTWQKSDGGVWSTTVDGKTYVMEPETSTTPSYVVNKGNMLPVKEQLVISLAVGSAPPSPEKKKKKKK